MRMLEHDYDDKHWLDLFLAMYEKGIRTHHVSYEYNSFDKYSALLSSFVNKYPDKPIKHIVKLSEPNFSHGTFRENRLEKRIKNYKEKLQTNHIHTLQWMWRGNLKNEKERLISFKRDIKLLRGFVEKSKKKQLFKNFFVFPYTRIFAKVCINIDFIDGFTFYRNRSETYYDDLIDECGKVNKKCIVIRPFFAGKEFENARSPISLISYALNIKPIIGAIASISRSSQLNFD